MENSRPRSARMRRSGRRVTSSPQTEMLPETMRAFRGSSRMTALHSMLLPQPDSPTSASTSPSFTVSETSRTASTTPEGVSRLTDRCSIFRSSAMRFSFIFSENQFSIVHSATFQKMPTP